jgi:hypothetical protein
MAYQSDLNAAPFWVLNPKTGLPVDALDPENSLYDTNWRNLPASVPVGGSFFSPYVAFTGLVHPLQPVGNPPQAGPVNLLPVVMSAGPPASKPSGTPKWDTALQAGQLGPALFGLTNDFAPTNTTVEQANLYGYRVRGITRTNN